MGRIGTGGGGIGDGVLEALGGREMDLSLGLLSVVMVRMLRGLEIPFPQFLEDMYILIPERDSGIEGHFSLKGRGVGCPDSV